MCGICGKYSFDGELRVRKAEIGRMMETLEHRGPDQSGMFVDGPAGLGHRRLNIIDLDSGRQPILNETGDMAIVFNGEIYNYQELGASLKRRGHAFRTRSDTEVILHLYEERGERCLDELRGMFAFAIYDRSRQRLFLARDRVGIKPLYYTATPRSLLFASEIKALLRDEEVSPAVNPAGISDFLAHTYTPGPATVFRNIWKLQPGHYLVAEKGGYAVREYWSLLPHFGRSNGMRIQEAEERLAELMRETIRIHEISDVPIGFLLSGGVDSTATLCFSQEELNNRLKAFTIGFGGQEFEDERVYARIAARKYGIDHYETTISADDFFDCLPKYVWHMEEPVFEPPAVGLYYVTKMAREHVKVLLSGEGGDECFAGYQTYRNLVFLERLKRGLNGNWERFARILSKVNRIAGSEAVKRYLPLLTVPLGEYYFSRSSNPGSPWRPVYDDAYSADFRSRLAGISPSDPFRGYLAAAASFSDLKKMLYVDTVTWLPDRLLLKADKMTMANSVELRVPLLDHKLLEFSAGLPDSFKLRGFQTKYLFKHILRGRVPEEILKRRKAGFPVPYARWMSEKKGFVMDLLLDPKTRNRGYFDYGKIRKNLLDAWDTAGRHPQEIFKLVVLELWHRQFIDPGTR